MRGKYFTTEPSPQPLESPSSMPEKSLLALGRCAGQLGSGVVKQGVWAIGSHCTSIVGAGLQELSLAVLLPTISECSLCLIRISIVRSTTEPRPSPSVAGKF